MKLETCEKHGVTWEPCLDVPECPVCFLVTRDAAPKNMLLLGWLTMARRNIDPMTIPLADRGAFEALLVLTGMEIDVPSAHAETMRLQSKVADIIRKARS